MRACAASYAAIRPAWGQTTVRTTAAGPYPRAHCHTFLLARAEQLIYSWTEGAATQSPDPVQ